MPILNSHFALFQPSEIQRRTPNPVMLHESVVWTKKIRKCKGFITKEFDRFWKPLLKYGNVIKLQTWNCCQCNVHKKKTMFDYILHCKHFCLRHLFQCYTDHNVFFFKNLDKAKKFSSLKFSICLIQREVIYLMAKRH